MAVDSSIQRISRLTPRSAILALIDARVGAVAPRGCSITSARGRVLAEDVVVAEQPTSAIALRDGFAVAAAAIADAGPYSPVPLVSKPQRVEVGEPLPAGTDAVAPFDAVQEIGDRAQAIGMVLPNEGALPPGGDTAPYTTLGRAGKLLRDIDAAAIGAAGVADVMVRDPRVRMACGTSRLTPPGRAAFDMLGHLVSAAGATLFDKNRTPERLYETMAESGADAGIVVGGTGSGRGDTSIQALARLGRVEAHGIAVSPGETAAFGFIGPRPVLLMPARLDAVLAVWLLIGRHLVATLAGAAIEDAPALLPLKRKVTSTIGLTELIPVRCANGMAEPLASGYLSLTALAQSDGWMVVPADSEGFAADTPVAVTPWP